MDFIRLERRDHARALADLVYATYGLTYHRDWLYQPDKLLEAAARTKVHRYREAYATRPGVTYAFLPCVISMASSCASSTSSPTDAPSAGSSDHATLGGVEVVHKTADASWGSFDRT